jgi:hypothetical protein
MSTKAEMEFTLEIFPLPEEIKLFVEDGLVEEIERYYEVLIDKDVIRVWSLKNTDYFYFMSGIRPTRTNGKVVVSGVVCNWADREGALITTKHIFEVVQDFDIIKVLVSRPDIYFSNEDINRVSFVTALESK